MAVKERRPGWWYPWIFVGCMGLVIVVNGIMITFALDTWTGLETKGHYQKGVEYNKALAAAQAQAERGWKMDYSFVPDAERKGEVRVRFRGRDGLPLDGLEVEAMMIRPTHEGHDMKLALAGQGGGVYTAQAALPLPGQWTLRVHAWRGDEVFQDSHKIVVP